MPSSAIRDQKDAILLSMRRKRDALNSAQIELLSRDAQENLIKSHQFQSALMVGSYFAFGSEVRTSIVLDEALRLGKRTALPRTESGEIRFYEFSKDDELVIGAYGIKEPQSHRPVDRLDLIVVPGLAFDRLGNRLGYGKGYYDKYLKDANAFSVGLGFSFQLVDKLPTDVHDVKLNGLATEQGMIYF